MEAFLYYLLAFLGVLLMFISLINLGIIDAKNKKSGEKKSKTKQIKLLIVGGIIFILSRVLHGQIF